MKLNRLPARNERPMFLAAFDAETKTVHWALEGEPLYQSDMFKDGTNWFQVWREGEQIHVQATQWYATEGDFHMEIGFVTPNQAVGLAEKVAYYANDMIDGGTDLSGL